VKRDLLAAFTFIISGILFYSIGSAAEVTDLGSTGVDCGASHVIMVVGEQGPEAPADVPLWDEGSLDS